MDVTPSTMKSAGKQKIKIRDVLEQDYLVKYAPNETRSKVEMIHHKHIVRFLLAILHWSRRERVPRHRHKSSAPAMTGPTHGSHALVAFHV